MTVPKVTLGNVAVCKSVPLATETVGFVAMSDADIAAGTAMMPEGIMTDGSDSD